MNTSQAQEFTGWLPVFFDFRGGQPGVEWCYFGDKPLSEPFFVNSVTAVLSRPFNHLFRRRTSLETLAALNTEEPGLKPSGLIFHLSRCGSTLVSQMLAALPEHIVLSEAEPLDAVLSAHWNASNVRDEQRVQWLRWMTGALGRPRRGEQRLFLKLDCWHILEWRLIEAAFPGVPWIFLYRDPVEVLVSHERLPGGQMVPGVVEPAWFGWNWAEVAGLPEEQFRARVLAKICTAALEAVQQSGQGRLINYTQLPDVVWSELPAHFGFALENEALASLQRAAGRDAKQPAVPFLSDSAAKQHAATPETCRAVEQWVRPVYQQLEALRQASKP